MKNFKANKKLFVISGSSGVGKGTVIARFIKQNPTFNLSISCTTRIARLGEVDEVNYFFLSSQEFQNCIKNEDFLEWAEFAGNFYGTKKAFVQKCLLQEKDLILEIDAKGAFQVKEQMGDSAVLIFIRPPSLDALETRLRGRGTEDEATIQKRLNIVKEELELAKKFDYEIINDNLDDAVKRLQEVINAKK